VKKGSGVEIFLVNVLYNIGVSDVVGIPGEEFHFQPGIF